MMRRAAPFALGLFAFALAPLVPSPARAQSAIPVSPAGATALQQQLHDWLASTLGPDAKVGTLPIQITAAGDHYELAVPLGNTPDAPKWMANAKPAANGAWQLDNIHLPPTSEFHIKLPDSVMQNAPPGTSADVTYKITIGQQNGQLLFDPNFATPSTGTSSVTNVDISSTGGMAPQKSHIDSGTGTFMMQPTGSNRMDMSIDSNLIGYSIDTTIPNAGPLKLRFGRAHVTGNATGISRERAVELIQTLVKIGKAMAPDANGDKPDEPPAELVEALLAAVSDLASGANFDETLQDVSVAMGPMAGSLHGFQVGFGVKGANGLVSARLDLGADGLVLPEMGLGPMVSLIPTKVSLRPTISNLPAEAAIELIKAQKEGDQPTPEQIMALFAKGPISAGLETLNLEVGGAAFTGVGKVDVASPADISGTGTITATNLDLLQQKIAAQPNLAQAAPVIIFLKGIGRTNGNQIVWDIAYRGGKLLVNNQDMSALTGGGGGGGGGGQPHPQTAPQQQAPASPSDRPQLRRRQ